MQDVSLVRQGITPIRCRQAEAEMDQQHEPPEGEDGGLEKVEARLEAADISLERARADEARAENEIEEAVEEIERIEADQREYEIIINGRPKTVERKKQSYRDIARLAYPDADFDKFLYTITYFNGEHGQQGDLVEGETVRVKNGMVFNVRRSDKS
jgi:hypothetical protein